MKETYILIDTFNKTVISRHRSIEAAVKADAKHDRDVKRNNGNNSFIPTRIAASTGRDIRDGVEAARGRLAGMWESWKNFLRIQTLDTVSI